VVIHAAAGGVGLLGVQGAKHLGAMVIVRVSTEEKARAAKDAGADHAIFATKQDFVNKIKHLTDEAQNSFLTVWERARFRAAWRRQRSTDMW